MYIAGALIGTALLLWLIYRFALSRGPKPDALFYWRCPECRQRVRYFGRQIGHVGVCPGCKRSMQFPTPINKDEDEEF